MLSITKVGKIKKRFPIVEFIESHGVQLKRVGDSYQGICPFHDDKTPSLRVTPSKGLWNCFGCNKGGDIITFYQYLKNIDNRQAIDELSRINDLGEFTPVKNIIEPIDNESILKDVAKLYHSSLMVNIDAQNYLKSRGLTNPELITKYQLGFCDGSKLSTIIKGNKDQSEACYNLGLVNDKGNESFYKCLTFPLLDDHGKVVGLYGRSIEGKRHHYSKGDRQGLFNAKACDNVESIILTESIIDALSLIQMGFMNVLPMFGVNGHTKKISSFLKALAPKEIILFLDNDEVAKEALKDLIKQYKRQKQDISVVHLPEGIKDINEYLVHGADRNDIEKLIEDREKHFQIVEKAIKEEGLIYRDPEQILFKYGSLSYRVKGSLKGQESMKLVLSAFSENSKNIDRIDLYSDRSRKSFANNVESKCGVKAVKIEEDLMNILFELEEKPQVEEAPKKTEVTMSFEEREKATQFLKQKKLMKKILEDITTLGYVGQDKEKLLLYLSATARITEQPIHVSIQSASSSGKSAMMDSVISLFPSEKVEHFSRISGQSLYYMESLKNKVIIVDERCGAEEAEFALRSLMSRNRLDLAVVQKDEKGHCKTKVIEIEGPTTVWDSTTHTISEDNRNRAFECFMDESKDQTRRIQSQERNIFSSDSWSIENNRASIQTLHQNAQRLLQPLKVEIPFVDIIDFPDISTRSRRDFKRFLYLIATVALLHQFQRPKKKTTQGLEYIEANLDDYTWAYKIAHDMLVNSYSLLHRDSRQLIELLQRCVNDAAIKEGLTAEDYRFSRREVRLWTRWSDFKVRQCLSELAKMEIVRCESGGRGRGGFRYKLTVLSEELYTDIKLTHPDELRRRVQLKNKNVS